jgi:hypothetical protein
MKKRTLMKLFLLSSLALTWGCGKTLYSVEDKAYTLPDQAGSILLDSRTRLYTRTVYTIDRMHFAYGPGIKVDTAKAAKPQAATNLRLLTPVLQAGSTLVEVEYLFISGDGKTALYISTVADRFKKRYTGSSFLGLTRPNADDFRVFLIGKIDPADHDRITFYSPDEQHTDTWYLRHEKDTLVLRQVEQKRFSNFEEVFLIDEALYSKVVFVPQPSWEINYLPKNAKAGAKPEAWSGNRISVGKSGKKFRLLFTFPGEMLVFPSRFVIYSPERNFTGP